MCLTCVIDRCSRLVVAWRLADDMGAAGVCACVEAAFAEHGTPSILNSAAYEGLLASNHVLQSTDGKARWVDNVIVERWFRSLKNEGPCRVSGFHVCPILVFHSHSRPPF